MSEREDQEKKGKWNQSKKPPDLQSEADREREREKQKKDKQSIIENTKKENIQSK